MDIGTFVAYCQNKIHWKIIDNKIYTPTVWRSLYYLLINIYRINIMHIVLRRYYLKLIFILSYKYLF